MKKAFSIFIAVLMVATLLHFSVGTHYCGGKVVSSNISLTGMPASCGMENQEKALSPSGSSIYQNCCKDVITYFGINLNYFQSVSVVATPFRVLSQYLNLHRDISFHSYERLTTFCTNTSPPWTLMYTNVDLSDICLFRI
jgi:hypothetical protein